MKDTFFIIVTKKKVDRMVKTESSALDLKAGQYAVKINMEVADEKFNRPYPEKTITVEPWDKNLEVEDVHFDSNFVTEEEEQMIREHRLRKMRERLEENGYTVIPMEEAEDDIEQD